MLPLSLSYDHRVIDGADAARFLRWVAEAFEKPFVCAVIALEHVWSLRRHWHRDMADVHAARRHRRRPRRLRRGVPRRRPRHEGHPRRSASRSPAASASTAAASRRRRCCTSPRSSPRPATPTAGASTFGEPKIDLDRLRDFKDKVVSKLTGGVGQLRKRARSSYVQGMADVPSTRRTLDDRGVDGAKETLTFEHCIIATGSRPATMPGLSIDNPRVMDSTGALELPDMPKTLLVVGGGYIGLEIGSVYAALGTQVTVVEMTGGPAARRRPRPRAPRASGSRRSSGRSAQHEGRRR